MPCCVRKEEMRSETCPFSDFSIRRYVAEVRQRDVEKCWPFHPQLSKSRLQQGTTNLLPSFEENVIQFQEKSKQQIDISEDNIVTHGQVNVMCKLEIVVPYCVNNQKPDEPEDNSTFHLREDGTYERGEEDGTNEKWACHLLGGIKSEEILSENNINKQNPDLEAKSPCFLREDETKENWAENKTNGNRAEGETNEAVAEEETNEKHAAYYLAQDIKSGFSFSENCLNKQNPDLEAKSPCFLREDETKENWAENKTNGNRAEGETNEAVAEEETNEKHAAYYLAQDIKSGFSFSENCLNKQKSELESKSSCLLREDETNEKGSGDETKEKGAEEKTNGRVAEEESNGKGAATNLSGDIKSEEIFSGKNINKQNTEVEAKSACLNKQKSLKEILSENKASQQAQSLTFGSSVPVIGGFAVRSSDSSVAKLKPDMRAHIPSFPKGTRRCTSKILSKEMFSPGKFAKGIISRERTQAPCSFQTCREENSKRYATPEGNKIAPKEQEMNGQGLEQISAKMPGMQDDSSKCTKRALELPPGANGQQPQKKNTSATSNIDQGPQKKNQPERPNIVILALPAFHRKKT